MVGTLVHQLTKNATTSEIENSPLALYYVDHGKGVWPVSAAGQAFTSMSFGVKGDPITDLIEDLAAEQKARTTYDNILRLSDDPDVNRVIAYLREREIVHFQRFGETKRKLSSKFAMMLKSPLLLHFYNKYKMYDMKLKENLIGQATLKQDVISSVLFFVRKDLKNE